MALCYSLWAQARVQAGFSAGQVLAAERAWLEAYNRRDAQAIARIEDDGFVITFADGRMQDKAAQLDGVRKPLPPDARYEIRAEANQVRLYGDVAILIGIVTESGSAGGQSFSQRSRYTDTWILRRGSWHVVASHLSNLR